MNRTKLPILRDPLIRDPLRLERDRIILRPPDFPFPDKIFRPRRSLKRSELTVPVAPTLSPQDSDIFESPDGGKQFTLPRYALAFDRIGTVDEPRIAIADRGGTSAFVVTLNQTPFACREWPRG